MQKEIMNERFAGANFLMNGFLVLCGRAAGYFIPPSYNNVWLGYIIAGVSLFIFYKLEKV